MSKTLKETVAHVGSLAMLLQELGHVEFRGLQDLGLPDVDVVEGVDALGYQRIF